MTFPQGPPAPQWGSLVVFLLYRLFWSLRNEAIIHILLFFNDCFLNYMYMFIVYIYWPFGEVLQYSKGASRLFLCDKLIKMLGILIKSTFLSIMCDCYTCNSSCKYWPSGKVLHLPHGASELFIIQLVLLGINYSMVWTLFLNLSYKS